MLADLLAGFWQASVPQEISVRLLRNETERRETKDCPAFVRARSIVGIEPLEEGHPTKQLSPSQPMACC